jgi:NAD(P)-dependent dehydrogenase (short-subunit alcohol dehydrogenase family)
MLRLQGKAALVIGGSRGIGAAIAKRLAADGADVALTFAKSGDKAEAVVRAIRGYGHKGIAIAADNRDSAAIQRAVDEAVSAFGRLDILINNAGIFTVATLDQATLDQFDEIFAVNVRAVFVASKAAARHLGSGGRIIIIGSILAERVPASGLSLYAASKAALVGLTKGMARDLGAQGVTVNLVSPGATNTDMNPEDGPRSARNRELTAVGRYAQPEEIAALVTWLASNESSYLTGTVLTIDGGANA